MNAYLPRMTSDLDEEESFALCWEVAWYLDVPFRPVLITMEDDFAFRVTGAMG